MDLSKTDMLRGASNRVWCCAWGLIKPTEQSESDDDQSASAKLKPREFVVTGGYQSELNIVHISPNQENVFPYQYSHQLPGMGVHNVVLSPDSSRIAAVSVDGKLTLLDVLAGVRTPNVSHNLFSNYWSTSFGDNNDYIYAGSGNGRIYKFDTEMGKMQYCYDTQRCECVLGLAIGKEDPCCLVGSTDYAGNFTLIDGVTGRILRRKNLKKPMRKLVFDVNMRFALAACDDKTIKWFELPSGRLRESLTGHNAYVMSVAISPDGQRFVSGACDGSIKVWDVRSTKCALSFICGSNRNLWDVAFNRMSNKISFVGDGKGLSIYYCMGKREMLLV